MTDIAKMTRRFLDLIEAAGRPVTIPNGLRFLTTDKGYEVVIPAQDMDELRAALTAYTASQSTGDETVERVLLREVLTWLRDPRLNQWNYMEGTAFYVDKHAMAEKIEAALSALPRADDALEGLLAKALRRLAYWAQTSGGTAGRDDGLVAAIDVGLAALREYDTKHAPPAQAGER